MRGALAIGRTSVYEMLEGEDVMNTAFAMRALGARVARVADEGNKTGSWWVDGLGVGGLAQPDDILDFGNAGTGARLALGLLAGNPISATLTGDASLRKRPMGRVIAPLEQMGARFVARDGNLLPLTITGTDAPLPIGYRLPVPSAQVKSAILLAGLSSPGTTTVIEPEPTRDHTERMLRHFGATVTVEDTRSGRVISLKGQPELKAADIRVPGDPSSAAFPIVAALIVPGSDVTILNVGLNPLRTGLLETLRAMGARLRQGEIEEVSGEPVTWLELEAGPLAGIEVPAARAPSMIDEYPILAVAAACARGTTRLEGLAELRVKESDRLAAIEGGLAACGVRVEAGEDSLTIHGCAGPPPGGASIDACHDHRIAMSFLVLGGAAAAPVTVEGAETIETSFLDFAGFMNRLGARIETVV